MLILESRFKIAKPDYWLFIRVKRIFVHWHDHLIIISPVRHALSESASGCCWWGWIKIVHFWRSLHSVLSFLYVAVSCFFWYIFLYVVPKFVNPSFSTSLSAFAATAHSIVIISKFCILEAVIITSTTSFIAFSTGDAFYDRLRFRDSKVTVDIIAAAGIFYFAIFGYRLPRLCVLKKAPRAVWFMFLPLSGSFATTSSSLIVILHHPPVFLFSLVTWSSLNSEVRFSFVIH